MIHTRLLLVCLAFVLQFTSLSAFSQSTSGKTNHKNIPKAAEVPLLVGDSLVIRNIFVDCHKRTKDRIIVRELAISSGDKIAREQLKTVLDQEANKVFNTGLFVKVDAVADEFEKGIIDVVIVVREQWYLFPIPLIDFADRNINEWIKQHNASLDRLEYGMYFQQKNFRGRNEDLILTVQLGFTKRVALDYKVPYINKKQTIGMDVGVSYNENKNLAYATDSNKLNFLDSDRRLRSRFQAGIGFTKRSKYYSRHSVSMRYHENNIADTIARLNENYYLNGRKHQRFLSLEYNFTYDHRDRAPYPLKGEYLALKVLKQGILPSDDLNSAVLTAHLAKFWAYKDRLYWSTSLLGKLSLPRQQPYSELRGLGYNNFVMRGFDQFVIEGQHLAIHKTTVKVKLFNSEKKINFLNIDQFNLVPLAAYFKVFADYGFVQNTSPNAERNTFGNQWLMSYGAGIDFVTYYNFVARFEYVKNNFGQFDGFFFNLGADF